MTTKTITVSVNAEVEQKFRRTAKADVLLTKFGIRDYFDRMIYSTAAHLNCVLLTEDVELHELFRKTGGQFRPKGIMRWKDLLP